MIITRYHAKLPYNTIVLQNYTKHNFVCLFVNMYNWEKRKLYFAKNNASLGIAIRHSTTKYAIIHLGITLHSLPKNSAKRHLLLFLRADFAQVGA